MPRDETQLFQARSGTKSQKKKSLPSKNRTSDRHHFIERSIRRNERMASHSRPDVCSAAETEFIFRKRVTKMMIATVMNWCPPTWRPKIANPWYINKDYIGNKSRLIVGSSSEICVYNDIMPFMQNTAWNAVARTLTSFHTYSVDDTTLPKV